MRYYCIDELVLMLVVGNRQYSGLYSIISSDLLHRSLSYHSQTIHVVQVHTSTGTGTTLYYCCTIILYIWLDMGVVSDSNHRNPRSTPPWLAAYKNPTLLVYAVLDVLGRDGESYFICSVYSLTYVLLSTCSTVL